MKKVLIGLILTVTLIIALSYVFLNKVQADTHSYEQKSTWIDDDTGYVYVIYDLYVDITNTSSRINNVSGYVELTGYELVDFEIYENTDFQEIELDLTGTSSGNSTIHSFEFASNTVYTVSDGKVVYASVTVRRPTSVTECIFSFYSEVPTLVNTNDVEITKTAVDTENSTEITKVSVGDEFLYEVTITNKSVISTDDVVLTDEIPSYFQPDSSAIINDYPECTVDGQKITCEIGSMEEDKEITYYFPVTVLEGASGRITNTATVTINETSKSDYATVEVVYSDIEITKVANVTQIRPGDEFTYTITVKNNGTGTSNDLLVYDILDDDLIYVDSNPGYYDYDDGTYIWDIGSLEPEGSITITIKVRLNSNSTKTSISNTAEVCEKNSNECPDNTVDIPVLDSDIKIEKMANVDEVRVGDTFTYTITVTNIGDAVSKEITVSDNLNSHLKLINVDKGTVNADNTFTYTISSLGIGQSEIITLTVQVLDTASSGDEIYNKACAAESGRDEVCDGAEIEVIDSNVTITKTVNEKVVNVGDEFTYTITIENTSDYDSRQITIIDDIDSNLEIVEVSDNVKPNGNKVTFNVGILEAHRIRTYTITVKAKSSVDDNTVIPNTAILKEVGKDDKEADVCVKVVKPNLSVTKTAETNNEYNYVNPGDEFTYRIIVKNSGNGDAKNVIITDEIDSRLTIVDPDGGTEDGQVITWTKDIAAKSSVTITVTVKVKDGVENNTLIPNVVVVTYEDKEIYDDDDVLVTDSLITLTKVASVDEVREGEDFYYTIRITNIGGEAAENLTLTDNLPSELSLLKVETPSGVINNSSDSNLSFSIASISPNQTYEIKVYVEVTGDVEEGDKIVNTATLTYDDKKLEDRDDVIVIDSNITIDKVASNEYVTKGEEYTYTVTIRNIGSASASNLEVVDTYDEYLEIIDADGGTVDTEARTITWNISSLGAGKSIQYTITVKVKTDIDKDTILNHVVVHEPDKPDKEDEEEVYLGNPSLTITKSSSVSEVMIGDEYIYYITIENTSEYDATNLRLSDYFDDRLIIIENDGGIIDGNEITWYFDLPANSSITFSVKVKVDEDVELGEISNIATLYQEDEEIPSNEVIVIIVDIINPQTGNIIKYSLIGGGLLLAGGLVFYTKKKGKIFKI